ncbi:MAG: DUF4129 domain-containing protein [Cyanobacteria bacterium P01_D01_bin.36]
MSDITHQTSSIGWQARQLLSRVNQAIEYRFSQTDVDLPDWEWPDWLRFDFPEIVGQIIFWFVISALTLWLAWLLYLSLEPMVTEWLAKDQKWTRFGQTGLEEEVERSAGEWLKEAQALAKAGQYGEACKALYRATLQQLHEREMVRHLSSRTDGEYLAALAKRSEVGEADPGLTVPRPYQLLIGTHERLVFAGTSASAEIFKRCRRAYEEIAKP